MTAGTAQFDAERNVDSQGRVKVKNVSQKDGGGGWRGRGGGGGGYQRRPPAEIPYADAIKLYKQVAVDLGDCYKTHPECATSIMIAIYAGDVLKPGQKPSAADPARAAATPQGTKPREGSSSARPPSSAAPSEEDTRW